MSHPSIERESPKPKLSALTRNYVIRTAQIILKANSNLFEATIEVLLEAHRKDPRRLAEHLNLALPVEIPRKPDKVSRAEIQT
jgi:hypothetical protein